MANWIDFLVLPLCAYLVGAIPTGVLIARAKGVDLRKSGSGNVGATNVGRVLGRRWGMLCFVLDVAKGLAPALAAGLWLRPQPGQYAQQAVWLLAGLCAVLGHVFNVFLRFRGGKGVATSLGVVLGMYPYFTLAGAISLAVWVVVTAASRYVSLGSIIAATAFVPVFLALHWHTWQQLWPLTAFAAAVVVLIIIRHRTNIARLLKGTENRIGRRGAVAGK